MARPCAEDKRTKVLKVRLTATEFVRLEGEAMAGAETLSAMVRRMLGLDKETGMKRTSVVNVRGGKKLGRDYDVYIGRKMRGHYGTCGLKVRLDSGERRELPDGYFGNPYKDDADWAEKFEEYARARMETDPLFRSAVEGLKGLRLGCWCRPPEGFDGELRCHGQILAALADGIEDASEIP